MGTNGQAPGRGPGANGGQSQMGEVYGMPRAQAEAMAAEMNWWQQTKEHVAPGYLQFFLKMVPVAVRVRDADAPDGYTSQLVPHVQMIAATQLGPIVLHLPAAIATQLAGQLEDHARECQTGITTVKPASPLLLPGQN